VHPEREGEAAVARDQAVVIDGNRIQAVGPAGTTKAPPGSAVIDGRGKWLVPGLVDGHVHFFQSGNLYTRPGRRRLQPVDAVREGSGPQQGAACRRPSRSGSRAASRASWMRAGPCGISRCGTRARATAAAPRVIVAGPLISMVDDPPLDLGDPPIIKTTTPAESRALAERILERKPDYVKVWFIHRKGDDLAAQEAIVKAAGDAAHAAGVRLASTRPSS
jgi:hypothetical protein